MTITARDILLEWSSKRPLSHQRVLAVALQDSKAHGEEIDKELAEQIINSVEQVIKEKDIK